MAEPGADGWAPMQDGVPTARPVAAECVELSYAPTAAAPERWVPLPVSVWRAIVELILLLPIGTLAAAAAYVVFREYPGADPRWFHVATSYSMGVLLLACVVVMLRMDRHPAASIGWTARGLGRGCWTGLLAFALIYLLALGAAIGLLLLRPDLAQGTPAAQKGIEKAIPPMRIDAMLFMMAFVAVWEEVVFRGFVLSRLYAVFKRWWLAIPAGAIIFAIPHLYEGPAAVLMIMVLAVVMGWLLLWRGSLVPCIVLHFANNVVVMLLLRAASGTWR